MFNIRHKQIIISSTWLAITGATASYIIYFVWKAHVDSALFLLANGFIMGGVLGGVIWLKLPNYSSTKKALIIILATVSASIIVQAMLTGNPEVVIVLPFVFAAVLFPAGIIIIPMVIFSCIGLGKVLDKLDKT